MAARFTALGSRAKIRTDDEPTVVYCARHKDVIGMPPHVAFPRPTNAFFVRIVTSRWCTNRFRLRSGDPALQLSAPEGAQFVALRLKEHDEAFVSMRPLVAWTSEVRFKTHLTMQFAAMSLGQLFFTSVRGPGMLLFEVKGKPTVLNQTDDNKTSVDYSRVVAWDRDVRFEITGSTRLLDLYLTQVHVRPTTPGNILIGPDDRTQSGGGMLRRLLAKIYLPR